MNETVHTYVYICRTDDTVVLAAAEKQACPLCQKQMEQAGWAETKENND